jgi:glycosyltransferase involved in cell wall biosynthesis
MISPSITAIIPVWNGAHFLPRAVASIRAQTYAPSEIVVVDDGSTDDTARVAAHMPGVRLLSMPHRGLVETRRTGLQAAQGEFIAFLDADDWWSPDKLALQVSHLQSYPNTMIVLGHLQWMRPRAANTLETHFEALGPPSLGFSFGAALIHRRAFVQVNMGSWHDVTEDITWFMRAREQNFSILVHPETVLYYLRHDKNMSNDHNVTKQALLRLVKDSLSRRAVAGQEGISLAPLLYTDQRPP